MKSKIQELIEKAKIQPTEWLYHEGFPNHYIFSESELFDLLDRIVEKKGY